MYLYRCPLLGQILLLRGLQNHVRSTLLLIHFIIASANGYGGAKNITYVKLVGAAVDPEVSRYCLSSVPDVRSGAKTRTLIDPERLMLPFQSRFRVMLSGFTRVGSITGLSETPVGTVLLGISSTHRSGKAWATNIKHTSEKSRAARGEVICRLGEPCHPY